VEWPGADLRTGTVLFDNGRRLVAYMLDGTSRLIWNHLRVTSPVIAAAPNAHELTYIVGRDRQQLLHLQPDGRVRVVGSASMWEPPVFLRPPSRPSAQTRIYYTTQSESTGNGALMMQTTRGTEKVPVNLRGGESPLMVTGYPGSARAALTLLRKAQPPVVEFVLDQDLPGASSTWARFLSMGGSDGLYTPAWLTPNRVLVGTDRGETAVMLTLWSACGDPAERVGSYTPVRSGADGAPKPDVLALDGGHALVMSAAHPHVWSLFTVRTGQLSASAIPFRPGGWTVVRGPSRVRC